MRIHKIICPKCQAPLTSKAGVEVGTALACPKCKARFKVEAPDDEDEIIDDFEVVDDDEEAAPKKPTKPAAKKRPVRDEDQDEEQRPRRKRPPSDNEEDDEERPKARKRPADEELPRKKKKKKRRVEEESAYAKIKGNIWVRVSVLGVLLIGLGVAIYIRLNRERPADITITEKGQEEDYSKPITKDQLKTLPKQNPKVVPKAEPKQSMKGEPKPVAKLPGNDQATIQGSWEATKHIMSGQDTPEGLLSQFDMSVSDNFFRPDDKSNPNLKFTLDPSKSLAEIDLTDSESVKYLGIYRLRDANALEICYTTGGGPRPTEFASAIGIKQIWIVLKRKP